MGRTGHKDVLLSRGVRTLKYTSQNENQLKENHSTSHLRVSEYWVLIYADLELFRFNWLLQLHSWSRHDADPTSRPGLSSSCPRVPSSGSPMLAIPGQQTTRETLGRCRRKLLSVLCNSFLLLQDWWHYWSTNHTDWLRFLTPGCCSRKKAVQRRPEGNWGEFSVGFYPQK